VEKYFPNYPTSWERFAPFEALSGHGPNPLARYFDPGASPFLSMGLASSFIAFVCYGLRFLQLAPYQNGICIASKPTGTRIFASCGAFVSHPVDNALLELESRPADLIATSSRYRFWIQFVVLAAIVAALYYKVVFKLIFDWWNDPNFSHGFFVPLFAGFVVWQSRRKIESAPVKPSWFGLFVIFGSLALLIVGVLGSELFLSRTSLVFLLGGIIIYFCGWHWFRLMLFPWAVLFLMIPIPAIVFNNITLPLQFLASKLATGMLGAVGVPAFREGNIITLPAMKL